VVGPRTVLVLRLDLHGFRALGDEVPMLPTPVAQDKEKCLEDMLALVLDPDMRARL
jgi:hypothetical protein